VLPDQAYRAPGFQQCLLSLRDTESEAFGATLPRLLTFRSTGFQPVAEPPGSLG